MSVSSRLRLPLAAASVVLIVAPLLAANPASAAQGPTCFGLEPTMVGTRDADVLVGTSGRDVIMGRAGDDTILAMSGDDVICAGPGNDVVWGGSGHDLIEGNDGHDFLVGNAGDDTLDGGTGRDRLWGSAGDDELRGDSGADELVGGEGDDTTYGGDGNDSVWAGVGDDTVFGGPGQDVLGSRWGANHMDGGEGADVLWGGEGPDTLVGATGADTLWGGGGDNELFGGFGDDLLTGGDENDLLNGGPGDDVLSGRSGNDELIGGDGSDQLSGDAGDDHLYGGGGRDRVDGGDGSDTVNGGDENDVLLGGAGRDVLIGGGGADVLWSGDGNDSAFGGDGNDEFAGGAGDDELYGGRGRDVLFGGDGRDLLRGDAGNDEINGGNDLDRVSGGAGHDTCEDGDEVDDCEAIRHRSGRVTVSTGTSTTPQVRHEPEPSEPEQPDDEPAASPAPPPSRPDQTPAAGARVVHGTGRLVEATTTFGYSMPVVPKTIRSGNLDRRLPERGAATAANYCSRARSEGYPNVALSVPLAWQGAGPKYDPDGSLAAMQAVADGRFDHVYRGIARALVDCGYDNAILRLGHEHNMRWTPWYSGDGRAPVFVAAWRRAADIIRVEAPGIALDWNIGASGADPNERGSDGSGTFDPASWPGDRYVDIVGRDLYCRSGGRNLSVIKASLEEHAAFAAAHGKPLSYPEVGVTLPVEGKTGTRESGTDSVCAEFIDLVLGFANANDLAYFVWWNSARSDQGYRYSVTSADKASWAALRRHYG